MKNHLPPENCRHCFRRAGLLIATIAIAISPCPAVEPPAAPGGTPDKEARLPDGKSPDPKEPRVLAINARQKTESMDSMLGLTTTTIFYRIPDQAAVVIVRFDNQKPGFPAGVKITLFAPGTSGADIDKWINNQHSDGLYIDPPEPVFTELLPENTAMIGEIEHIGDQTSDGPEPKVFSKHSVRFSINACKSAQSKFILKPFTDSTTVFKAKGR